MYAVVDIETTGGHASANGITEIAICLHDGKKVTQRYSTLVNPGREIPIYISALTGITNDMDRRLTEHGEGHDPSSYTHHRRPVKLVYLADFQDVNEAIAWEKRLKRWSRAKKEALILQKWDSLSSLSRCKNVTQCLKDLSIRATRYSMRHEISIIISSVSS